jgi:hypothetical protein
MAVLDILLASLVATSAALPLAITGAACARSVPAKEPQESVATSWCFAVTVDYASRPQAGQVCAETYGLCTSAASMAMSIGGMGGLTAVGACRRER